MSCPVLLQSILHPAALRSVNRALILLLPGGSGSKRSACNAGDPALIPRWGRSHGEGNGNPLQYSCLENSMNGGALWAAVHGVTKSRVQLSNKHFHFSCPHPGLQPGCPPTALKLDPTTSVSPPFPLGLVPPIQPLVCCNLKSWPLLILWSGYWSPGSCVAAAL